MARDIDFDDLTTWAAIAFAGYVLINWWRDSQAASAGAGSFPGQAPAGGVFDEALDIIAPMQISPTGQAFIKQQEGLTLVAKGDAGGREIGYGHEIKAGENIKSPITPAFAEQLFQADIGTVAQTLNNSVTAPLTQNQFDALGSLVFNMGAGNWNSSSILKAVNARNYQQAAEDFQLYNRSQGSVNGALNQRRQREQNLFNGGST